MRTPSRLVLAACAALFAACGACSTPPPAAAVAPPRTVEATSVEKTASSKVTLKLNPAWATCHSGFVPAGEQPAAVASALALTCGAVTHFHKVGEAFAGSQAAAAAPQAYRWSAKAGHCYRAYGAGAPSIKTMDVFIKDSAGIVLGQSASDDRAPVALDAGAVCFKEDDDAAVVVSIGDGSGAYAVELWGD